MHLRSRVAALALVLGVSGVARAQRRPAGATADNIALYARLLAMTDTRQLDSTVYARALSSGWSPLRAAAALAAGQIGPERGSPVANTLRGLLGDGDKTVAANAAY